MKTAGFGNLIIKISVTGLLVNRRYLYMVTCLWILAVSKFQEALRNVFILMVIVYENNFKAYICIESVVTDICTLLATCFYREKLYMFIFVDNFLEIFMKKDMLREFRFIDFKVVYAQLIYHVSKNTCPSNDIDC